MRVGLDLDGVLFNFGDSVHRYMQMTGLGHLWKSGPIETPYWNFYEDWGWTTEQFVELCHKGADAGIIFSGPTRPGAVQMAWDIFKQGHDLIIITDRSFGQTPEVSQRITKRWWKTHHFPNFREIHFTADKPSVKVDCMIDDKLQNYDDLTAAGVKTYLLNRPWNQIEGGDTRDRINTLSEYVDKVSALSQLVKA